MRSTPGATSSTSVLASSCSCLGTLTSDIAADRNGVTGLNQRLITCRVIFLPAAHELAYAQAHMNGPRLVLMSVSLVLALSAVTVGAAGLPDPVSAKAADGCQRALAKAAAKFTAATAKNLEQCYDALFTCMQTKPGDQPCVDKARAKCAAAADVKAPAARAALAAAVAKKCASFADLTSPDGLGYEALASACQNAPLGDVAAIAECVRVQHECAAEQMFSVEMPRAGQLAAAASLSLRAGSCLAGPRRRGRRRRCQGPREGRRQVSARDQEGGRQAGRREAEGARGLRHDGVRLPADQAGRARSARPRRSRPAHKAIDVTLAAAEAKAAAALDKPCRPIFAELGAATALNLGALAYRLPVRRCREPRDPRRPRDVRRAPARLRRRASNSVSRRRAPKRSSTTSAAICGAPSAGRPRRPRPRVTPPPTTTATPTATATATPTLTATPTRRRPQRDADAVRDADGTRRRCRPPPRSCSPSASSARERGRSRSCRPARSAAQRAAWACSRAPPSHCRPEPPTDPTRISRASRAPDAAPNATVRSW